MPHLRARIGAYLYRLVYREFLDAAIQVANSSGTARPIGRGIRRIMDEGQVLLVNLSKGKLGEDSSSLLGGLLVTTIGLAAFSRADTPPQRRRDFFVYVDEFQSFTTLGRGSIPV